jgi:hypothetical protein
LNHRPLGYEFDSYFAFALAGPDISMRSPIMLHLDSICFGLVLARSGSGLVASRGRRADGPKPPAETA